MRVSGKKFQGLFGESNQKAPIPKNDKVWQKNLTQLNVDIDSVKGFFLLGGATTHTQSLISDIEGPLERPNRELLLTFNQSQSYWKLPTYYMGPKEHFIIAINLAYHYRDSINYYQREAGPHRFTSKETAKIKKINLHLQITNARLHEEPDLEDTLCLFRGIKYYDEARECTGQNKSKSKTLLRKAKDAFLSLLEKNKEIPTVVTFLGIIEALLGRVESALKFLVHAADLIFNPKIIYKIMSKLFNILRMRKAALFYKRRSKSGLTRLKHSPKIHFSNLLNLEAA